MRKKSLIRRLIPWIIAAVIIGGIVYLGFLIYGGKDTEVENPPTITYYEGDGKPLEMSNEYLAFSMDPSTTHFTVTDLKTGIVWASNPEGRDKDPIAKTLNKDTLSSTLIVTYTTSGGVVDWNNYTYSIANQTYSVYMQEDGSIRVDYSIGKIAKVYKIPEAITVERFDFFWSQMSKGDQTKFKNNYTRVGPSNIDSRDNKDELIALYPSVVEQELYILKSGTSDANKGKILGYLEKVGYTEDDYEIDSALVAGRRETEGPVFNVSMIYRLDGPDLIVEVPYSEIHYRPAYPITFVSPLPMFGAAGTEAEGYLLIPEGGGAIINYNNGKTTQSAYRANLYGWDYAQERTEAVSETENAFPVFGATQGDSAFICIMEGASSYASVYADIAGRFNSYNTVYARYNVLHAELYKVSNKTADKVYVYEKEIPDDCIRQRYRFVNSNRHADLATAYGDYLREKIPELSGQTADEAIPVSIELIGAINKNVIKFGMPVDSVVPTTTFNQARGIIDELTDASVTNLYIRMTGWSNGGVRQKVLTGVHVLNELGGEREMSSLIAEARLRSVSLSFDGITCFAYNSGILDGFLPFRDAARFATREQVHLWPYDIVTGQYADWMDDDFYLTKPSYASKNAENLIRYLQDHNSIGIAFRDTGNLLSADYNPRDPVTREQVKQQDIEILKQAKETGMKITIKEGNDYAMPYADLITDMNLTGQGYGIVDDRIPFYQIAIHGLKNYTGKAINLSGDYVTMLLECAEYGAGLNFTFMAEDTRVLQDSTYSNYTSAGYSFWKSQVIDMILRYQQEMSGLNQIRITGHERLNEDVTVTTYEDGTQVFVNYGNTEYSDGAVRVPARDYLVKRGNSK